MTILAINIPFILETLTLGIIASLIVALAVEIWKKCRKKHHISVTLDSSDVYSSQTFSWTGSGIPLYKSRIALCEDYAESVR